MRNLICDCGIRHARQPAATYELQATFRNDKSHHRPCLNDGKNAFSICSGLVFESLLIIATTGQTMAGDSDDCHL